MENQPIKIQTLKIDENQDQKINIYFDVYNETIVFEGCYKTKYYRETLWKPIASRTVQLNKNSEVSDNFEIIIKELLKTMKRRIELFNLIKTFLDNADLIQIETTED